MLIYTLERCTGSRLWLKIQWSFGSDNNGLNYHGDLLRNDNGTNNTTLRDSIPHSSKVMTILLGPDLARNGDNDPAGAGDTPASSR